MTKDCIQLVAELRKHLNIKAVLPDKVGEKIGGGVFFIVCELLDIRTEMPNDASIRAENKCLVHLHSSDQTEESIKKMIEYAEKIHRWEKETRKKQAEENHKAEGADLVFYMREQGGVSVVGTSYRKTYALSLSEVIPMTTPENERITSIDFKQTIKER